MNPSEAILIIDDIFLGPHREADPGSGISVTVHASEFVAVAGPSGAEKSELLLTAAGFREARHGNVRLLGASLARRISGDNLGLRRQVGFVFQEPTFLHDLSAVANVQLPLRYDDVVEAEDIVRRSREMLAAAGVTREIKILPEELPSFERRKVALARAWIREPRIVFYDEPAKGLDPANQKNIYRSIHDYHENRKRSGKPCAALLVCNDPRWVLEFADRYFFLKGGILTSKADQTNIRGRQEALEKDYLNSIQAV
jgi:putative ABC transport system ATP-binding protein